MTIEFRLPDLGENVTEGEVVRLLVKEGDVVQANQPVMELETEKALLEVPSPSAGKISKLYVQAGKKLRVNEMILTLEEEVKSKKEKGKSEDSGGTSAVEKKAEQAPKADDDEPIPLEKSSSPRAEKVEAKKEGEDSENEVEPAEQRRPAQAARVVEVESAQGRQVPAAPSTRRLARELGVDLSEIKPSAPGGRVTTEDVKEFVKSKSAPAKAPQSARIYSPVEQPALPDFSKWGPIERKALSNIRKKTMERISLAWSLIPHVTQVDEADVTDLEALRERHAERAAAKGGKLTATVFVLKAIVSALKQFPQFNASLDPASEEVILKQYYHLGIAVDTEHGLIVPVIRDVDKKPLLDLSTELSLISERARQRKIALEELFGATFTITNLGGLGGTAFSPIINWPEVAILGLARYQKRLVLRGDRMENRLMLPLCLSYDHRIIDGADAVRFTRKIASMLEDPALLLLEP